MAKKRNPSISFPKIFTVLGFKLSPIRQGKDKMVKVNNKIILFAEANKMDKK